MTPVRPDQTRRRSEGVPSIWDFGNKKWMAQRGTRVALILGPVNLHHFQLRKRQSRYKYRSNNTYKQDLSDGNETTRTLLHIPLRNNLQEIIVRCHGRRTKMTRLAYRQLCIIGSTQRVAMTVLLGKMHDPKVGFSNPTRMMDRQQHRYLLPERRCK